ncbi:hypothetical protein K227x_61930 [Rubripirellula lacrimiformis]|uniref:Uncharacterized protein n=1 Tax=Rubripirellula lacrimiformis TaxID=1930273 RepID=A0A517NKU5_9BACT|nr:hypothetical protein K227x_61930 [Rubripirellula lacrimiformis]
MKRTDQRQQHLIHKTDTGCAQESLCRTQPIVSGRDTKVKTERACRAMSRHPQQRRRRCTSRGSARIVPPPSGRSPRTMRRAQICFSQQTSLVKDKAFRVAFRMTIRQSHRGSTKRCSHHRLRFRLPFGTGELRSESKKGLSKVVKMGIPDSDCGNGVRGGGDRLAIGDLGSSADDRCYSGIAANNFAASA